MKAHLALQAELERVAPDVQNTVWGHKYLALLFPHTIDEFHATSWQRYQLVRLLQLPPQRDGEFVEGRYVCAGHYAALARELDLPLHTLAVLLKERNGAPRHYWRIGTTDNEKERRRYWPVMAASGAMAVGWPAVGDLSKYVGEPRARDAISRLLGKHYNQEDVEARHTRVAGRVMGQLARFLNKVVEGHRVLASDGQTVLGVGEVIGPYRFVESHDFPHQRLVNWRSMKEWKSVDAEGLLTSLATVKDLKNQVETERRILEDAADTVIVIPPTPPPEKLAPIGGRLPRLSDTPGAIQAALERKGQVILYGPPGTGKTYWALRAPRDLASLRAFGRLFADLADTERVRVESVSPNKPPLVRMCSFHPEYAYEDFIEGYRPRVSERGELSFTLTPGLFQSLCRDAAHEPNLDFHLIIDEINRGDIPRIFGELLTLLERDKRGYSVTLPGGQTFGVPPNVYVIGTMNTADRSIALLDTALRRRFGFVELMPDYTLLRGVSIGGLPLGPWLEALNAQIRALGGSDARNRQIGHAFLLDRNGPITTVDQLAAALHDDIVPLLEEYCYDDFDRLVELLGPSLVDAANQRIRKELFEADRRVDVIAALQRPEIATMAAAVMSVDRAAESEESDTEDDAEPPMIDATS